MPFTVPEPLDIAILSHAIESVPTAVSITDPEDRILYVNGAFLELYGYGVEDLPGLAIADLRADRVPPEVASAILPATADGGWQGLLWQKRKDGTEFLIELVTSPVRDPQGRTVALIGAARDITDEMRREAHQACLYEIARAAQEEATLDRLLAAIREIVAARVEAPGFALYRRDAAGDLALVHEETAAGLSRLEGAGEAFANLVVERRCPLRLSPGDWDALTASGVLPGPTPGASWLGAPLTSEGAPIGALVLRNEPPGLPYDDRDLELLEFVANQTSQAVERRRIEEQRHADLSFKTALSVAVSNAGLGILILEDERIVYANSAAAALTGYTTAELKERAFVDLVHPDEHDAVVRRQSRKSETFLVGETYDSALKHRDGRRVEVELSMQPFGLGGERRYVATLHDITPLVSLTRTDSLTTLPNRKAVEETLRKEWERARRRSGSRPPGLPPETKTAPAPPGALLALLMIDVDRFRAFNDLHGPLAGDETLRRTAVVMRSCLRAGDFLGRYGGEEFLAILPDTDLPGATATAERLRSAVERDAFYDLPDGKGTATSRLHVTVSVGVATVADIASADPLELLVRADHALYRAKEEGRNRVVVA